MKVASLVAAGILALGAGAATADGIYAPYPQREADWTGLFVSASIGYGWADTALDVTSTPNGGGPTTFTNGDGEPEGFLGAVGAGYDLSIGNDLILGVFGDFTFGEMDDRFTTSGGVDIRSSYDDVWAIGGRIGYVVAKDTMLYGTIGYTQADFHASNTDGTLQDDLDGYFVGAGLDRKICDSLFLKAEYRYSDYDNTSTFETTGGGACGGPCDVTTDWEHEIHTIRVGLAYKFGHRETVSTAAPLK